MKKINETTKEIETRQKNWREGFEAGVKTFEKQKAREIKIGEAILDVMFEVFEANKENS